MRATIGERDLSVGTWGWSVGRWADGSRSFCRRGDGAEHDKESIEMWVPLSEVARHALDRLIETHPAVGEAPIFPSLHDPNVPWSRWRARDLLEAAEAAAELEHIPGLSFHSLRRKWATERKHLPAGDVAAAGGWKDRRTLEQVYQQTDELTMLQVVSEPRKLREAT